MLKLSKRSSTLFLYFFVLHRENERKREEPATQISGRWYREVVSEPKSAERALGSTSERPGNRGLLA